MVSMEERQTKSAIMKKMLNIGCGHRFHRDWVNIDVDPASPEVIKADIINGIPYPDNHFDVVYHSNVGRLRIMR